MNKRNTEKTCIAIGNTCIKITKYSCVGALFGTIGAMIAGGILDYIKR